MFCELVTHVSTMSYLAVSPGKRELIPERDLRSEVIFSVVIEAAMISDSVLDMATINCCLLHHDAVSVQHGVRLAAAVVLEESIKILLSTY